MIHPRPHDTEMGGPAERFPDTQLSAVRAALSPDPGERELGLSRLIASYWKPVYKHLRMKWNAANDDAKDLTQGFFTEAIDRAFFERFDSRKASFRTYLRVCLDGYVANQRKAEARLKRGGGRGALSLDFDTAESEFARASRPDPTDADVCFEREWLRELFARAVGDLRAACETGGRQVRFALFERYDLGPADGGDRPTYEQLAAEFNLPATQVTNHLAWARREFRRCLFDALRAVTGSDEEFREEARRLLGGDVA